MLPIAPATTGISTADDFKRDLVEKVKSWGLVARRKRGLPPGSAAAPGSNVPAPPKKLYPGAVTLRPQAVQDSNELSLWRLVDGEMTREAL